MPIYAEFEWTPPESETGRYVVELFETHVAQIRAAASGEVLVHSPRWDPTTEGFVFRSGFGPAYLSDRETRASLYGAAAEAIHAASGRGD